MTPDSASSDNYVRPQDSKVLSNLHIYHGQFVILPDKTKVASTHGESFPLSINFSDNSKMGTVLPQLSSKTLLSMGKF